MKHIQFSSTSSSDRSCLNSQARSTATMLLDHKLSSHEEEEVQSTMTRIHVFNDDSHIVIQNDLVSMLELQHPSKLNF